MSKKTKNNDTSNISWGFAYVIPDEIPNSIIGNIMEVIEAAGLPSKQEESIKNLIKSKVWNIVESNSVYISRDRHNQIRSDFYEEQRKSQSVGRPPLVI